MLEKLLGLERGLFLTLNNWHTAFLDNALWLCTSLYVWLPFVVFFLIALIYGKPMKEWLPILAFMIIMGLIGHLFVAGFFKPFFMRLRPIFHPDFMNDITTYGSYTGGGLYGFISGHSTFVFALATFTSLVFRYSPYTIIAFVWAAIIAYSRIYFGVHFLSDIAGGLLVGIFNGIVVYGVYQWYVTKFVYKDKSKSGSKLITIDIYSQRWKQIVTGALACYMAMFFIFGGQIVSMFA